MPNANGNDKDFNMKTRKYFTLCLMAFTGLVFTPHPANASLKSCVAGLKRAAIKAGVKASVANKALANVRYDEKVARFSRTQPEKITYIWDYMAFLVDAKRIADGKAMMRKYARTLRAVEKAYGVDRYIITALWGIESDYGKFRGDFYTPHSLANLVCGGNRRARLFKRELIITLQLVSRGDIRLSDLKGSWAGAFGQTQFMPSTYKRLAVDFDRNGRRDLVNSVPDALASTANFLRKAGWRPGQTWGYEVRIPKNYRGRSGRRRKVSLTTWGKRGIVRLNGRRVSGKRKAGLILPAGKNGPAFLVFRNFDVLYSYNVALSYALSISHLSDRLRGRKPIARAWPTNDPGLTRAQRLHLQRLLNKNGFNVGKADGRIGPVTRAAIKKAQAKYGMKADGRPGMKIYRKLGGA